ncbi:MAG: molybdopterin-dependent oxidoreductase [Pseudomonadota bacterium]
MIWLLLSAPVAASNTSESDVGSCVALAITVDGIAAAEQKSILLTLSDLQAFKNVSFVTSTPWTQGDQEFMGVWMADLLQDLDVTEGTVTLTALNDYSVSLPVSDFESGGAMLAFKRNGAFLSPRKKGPFWIVWNYDSDPAFRTETIYSKSIWQLDRISVSQ